jgi:hypothetical protein
MTITINPAIQSNAAGTFNVSSTGLIQGMAYPDPATRYSLNAGILLAAETLPMWGGVAIFEQVPGADAAGTLGCPVGRSTTVTGGSKPITAFAVFDQGYSAVNSPQSEVPLISNGGQVMYYRLGSKARIAVAADANLISLRGGLINANVSWDFVNQQLIPYSAPTFSSGSYSGTTVTLVTAAPHGLLPGDQLIVSGATGTGSFASINGQYTLIAGTTGSTLKYTIASGLTLTITGATLGTGADLPVDVIDVQATNSMIVGYNSVTGFANWNRNGACAIISI